MTNDESLRIVIYEEDGILVAQCLEYDICAQACDRSALVERMDCLIECEMEQMATSGEPLDPAPEKFHNMWDEQGSHSYRKVAA